MRTRAGQAQARPMSAPSPLPGSQTEVTSLQLQERALCYSTIISTPKSSRNGDTGHEGPRGALLDERGGNGRADRPRNSVQHAALEPETSRVLQPHTRCPRRNDVDIFQQDMWEIATATETAMKRNPPVYHGFSKTGKKRKIGESVPKPRQCCHVPVGSPSAGSSLGKVIRRACP